MIKKQDQKLIRKVELFDVYAGKQIPKGKKSMAINVVFQAEDKTLEEAEINQLHDKIVRTLDHHGIKVRGE